MSNIELLAPAGNFECLKAAVQSGADAVYFAGKNFGARSYAQNFSKEEIKQAIDYCHLRGIKTHITINTAYSDAEISSVIEFVDFLYKEGADALIVSDVGLISLIKKHFPKISVHASTQMTIHSLDGVKFAENLGADRVVLSRELSFNDIDYISSNCSAEIEVFVHGALCMSYSGQCLLSSMIGGRSGNRGSCAQPCRLPFGTSKEDKKFLLSLKDLSLINHIASIKNSKIRSLKIEGRMKGAQYVAAVVSTYRKYLDNSFKVSDSDKEVLERVFYRGGQTDGYFTGEKGEKMFTFEKPDNPYLKQSKDILSEFDKNFDEINLKKIDVDASFCAAVGEEAKVAIKSEDAEIFYKHNNICQAAKTKSVDDEFIKVQLLKTGGTPYNIKNLDINIAKGVFLSKSELNEIRRNALSLLEQKILENNKRESDFNGLEKDENINITTNGYSAFVSSIEQLNAVAEFDFKRIYISYELYENIDCFKESIKDKIVIALPEIIFDSELEKVEKLIAKAKENDIDKLLINNPSQLKYSKDYKVFLSYRFNIWNEYSLKYYKDKYNVSAACLSPELSLKSISKMNKAQETEIIAYGHIPVMITENCIIKNTGKCPCNGEFVYITDRIGAKFPVRKAGNVCRSILYNSVPIYLADKKNILNTTGCAMNLYFTVETPENVKKICKEYLEDKADMPESFTRGHYFK